MSFIKKICNTFKLHQYNRVHQVKIKSLSVSLKALFGANVEVGAHTAIDSQCQIGSYVYIGNNCHITKTKIGSYCSIANNVSIGQGEHDLKQISTSSIFYGASYEELTKKECSIGNDVWIGTDAVILRGVKIENGAVIGANAVVTKDIQAFEVVAGVPARHIKFRFPENKRQQINDSAWWKHDIEQARKLISLLEQ